MAPQAMVMKANGNSLPANTGPVPAANCVTAGILSGGIMMMIAPARMTSVPTLRNVDR